MSRKGKLPIPLPKGVEVKKDGIELSVKGPKGVLNLKVMPVIELEIGTDQIVVSIKNDKPSNRKWHGLYRSLIHNMVVGTTEGFEKRLTLIGVGYRANVQGNKVDLQVGFSHPTQLDIPEGIDVKTEKKNTLIIISGSDKQMVGQFAADIRSIRPPEPYKGKGIRYENEYVRKKAGKSAAKG
ncbi:MAG: 50S ribosomal protein L6 [Chlamydiae bacterium]|nr:50S ribosomal protein L6 [Chlamydiota bacterium]